MAVTFGDTLDWKAAAGDDAALLDDLQANILKGHVREHLCLLFLNLGYDWAKARAAVATVGARVKSARRHLEEAEAFTTYGTPGSVYVGLGLTRKGYEALGAAALPTDPSFVRGMRAPASQTDLSDPPVSTWETPYRGDVHAVVLVGDATAQSVAETRAQVLAELPAGVTVLGEETGLGRHNAAGDGIEHFGYVDGRSQPLFLTQDVAAEPSIADFDPSAPLGQVLVPDPGGATAASCGSYFVFRKLEQNVRLFKEAEEAVADALGLVGDDRERAGAMLVGRFEDGTPLVLKDSDGLGPLNDFGYTGDGAGARCPFFAHIRKTNPRGTGPGDAESEFAHLMARRGQTYGERADDPNAELPPSARPSTGVGLLFMAFNAKIEADFAGGQFDFTQKLWADNVNFPEPATGLDPVIGQGPRPDLEASTVWGGVERRTVPAPAQAVTMKGGEYFFMPSLGYLSDPR
jgi:Dyp-type peroxidase family